MFTRTSSVAAYLLLALPLLSLAAPEASCSGNLSPYCCETYSLTPRGYVGSKCTAIRSFGPVCRTNVLCCQKIEAGIAYYCGQPTKA
ncbi:hypothetical protein LshimejAT787_0605690 [Lyophyllum shimeji]|uniref:Uncharacterized protein n=1 Tax=Lyophyllum shimeji TaxID=47721 RepID=A0A9P3PQ90_LYOSH|nr:hypothetical protein LshimejAT787_0605690 [Lyophyllum shimeji]